MGHELSVGQWIKQRRKQLRLTQAELADQIGCAAGTLGMIEAGTRHASRHLITRCADYLHFTPEERAAFLQHARVLHPPGMCITVAPAPAPGGILPLPLTPLLGRSTEVAAITDLLRGHTRWVTIVGPPGVGKTRTSLTVAQELQANFADGVWFISLVHLRDPAEVLSTLVTLFQLSAPGQDPQVVLRQFLARRRLLLVLDNLEHLTAAVSSLADLVLHAPGLAVLSTSRSLLRMPGEQVVDLKPLPTPVFQADHPLERWAQVPAVALFIQRAQAVNPTFHLTAENVADVVTICRTLDGLPLAIELAAARSLVIPLRTLVQRLTQRVRRLANATAHRAEQYASLQAELRWS